MNAALHVVPQGIWTVVTDAATMPAVVGVITTPRDTRLPTRVADQQHVAIGRLQDGSYACFAVDPEQESVLVTLSRAQRAAIHVVHKYRVNPEILRALYDREEPQRGSRESVIERGAEDEALDLLLTQAIDAGATDIHVAGARSSAEILFRVHGELYPVSTVSAERGRALTRVLYTRANSKTKEWTDNTFVQAAISRTIRGREYRLRYQHLPTMPDSLALRLRILPMAEATIETADFAHIGFEDDQIRAVQAALDHPRGVVLLCGPMGSGKSTTLKASLEYLVKRFNGTQLIQTLEDPVEYQILGVSQTNVAGDIADPAKDNAAWSEALAAVMRSDANVIMLGEIRNRSTATASMHLTQTGHKILSTLHSISPFEAISRLGHLGWDQAVLTAPGNVAAVLRQQLVPVLCPECSKPLVENDLPRLQRNGLRLLVDDDIENIRVRGDGCSHCKEGRGHSGRTALLEILVPDDRINQHLVAGRRDEAERMWRNREAGVPEGLTNVTLLDHVALQVKRGRVSPQTVDLLVEPLAAMANKRRAR